MSKEHKLRRIDSLVIRNSVISQQIKKLKREFSLNHEAIKNLYEKAQIKDWDRPTEYRTYSCGDDWFE